MEGIYIDPRNLAAANIWGSSFLFPFTLCDQINLQIVDFLHDVAGKNSYLFQSEQMVKRIRHFRTRYVRVVERISLGRRFASGLATPWSSNVWIAFAHQTNLANLRAPNR